MAHNHFVSYLFHILGLRVTGKVQESLWIKGGGISHYQTVISRQECRAKGVHTEGFWERKLEPFNFSVYGLVANSSKGFHVCGQKR